jgi:hypothetical protein
MSFQNLEGDKHETSSPASASNETEIPLTLRCGDCSGLRVIKKEFAKKNLWMNGETSYGRVNWVKGFGASRFPKFTGIPFLIYRFLLACFGLAVLTWSIVFEEIDGDAFSFGYWLYFLTHWMVFVNFLCVFFLFISTCFTQLKYKETSEIWKSKPVPHYARTAWVTLVISLGGGLFVVLLYWFLLKGDNAPLSVLSHGGLWASIVFDFMFIGMQPYLLLHSIWCCVFGLAYGTWTAINYGAGLVNKDGNPWIYAPIKWGTAPGTAFFWAFVSPIVVLIPMYCLFWGFNFFRKQAIYKVDAATDVANALVVQEDGKV